MTLREKIEALKEDKNCEEYFDAVRHADFDKLERLILAAVEPKFGLEKPTVPGWYWFRDERKQVWCVLVELWKGGPNLTYTYPGSDDEWDVATTRGEWAGPILPPE